MLDFMMISTRATKRNVVEVIPKFIINKSNDLMIRGGDFYAVWDEEKKYWSTDEQDALRLIDQELRQFVKTNEKNFELPLNVSFMWDADSGMIDKWHKYCQRQLRDSYHALDDKLLFSNDKHEKKDYATKSLPYPLKKGDISAYDQLVSTLYSPDERMKIEWAVGSIVTGDSKKIQKFLVLYGEGGTGKSTILNIIAQLFDGYCESFDAKALGSANNVFALEAFKSNPLVAIQHDGDLSKIEDNTRLNSLVSHELMTVNEKFKSTYANRFKSFLFMGTNKPVKITDAKSGLIRRLIDVSPTGNKVPPDIYEELVEKIKFELGGIAYHCRDVYLKNKGRYNSYVPTSMLGASNDFYNFVEDMYYTFKTEDKTTLQVAWEYYNRYCEDAKVAYPYPRRAFKEELKNYFKTFEARGIYDGARARSVYSGFRIEKFNGSGVQYTNITQNKSWLEFKECSSILDKEFESCPAQYANEDGTPLKSWERVKTKLSEIDTSKLHYVMPPDASYITIDFDIPDEAGNKSYKKNFEAASKWPPTYAELSKSGEGIHLEYIYEGKDVEKLKRVYSEHVEVKVFTGKSSLRRKLSKCNDLPIATLSSGLPFREEKKMISSETIKSERSLRNLITKNLRKEIHPNTKPSMDFIKQILDDAYNSELSYDLSDMKGAIYSFAIASSNQKDYCVKLVDQMKFKSKDEVEDIPFESQTPIVFYDVECFPNLFLINWKIIGKEKKVIRMINPKPEEVKQLFKYRLVGFNCRRYDNHMIYAASLGYTNIQLYNLSQRIISGDRTAFFANAYNLSYTDIYDFASAGNKKSLKKLEIEMGIHHKELGLPWNEPVPEEQWILVAEYCDNDVIATEAAYEYLKADRTAREILADIAKSTMNTPTNTLTKRIIFGNDKHPQREFNYRYLGDPVIQVGKDTETFLKEACPKMMSQKHGEANSILPYFPGYIFKAGKSTYRGEEVGEGGYVYTEPGIHTDVALLDIASQHPHSLIAEALFGPKYTRIFREIVEGRVSIKHKQWDEVEDILGGALKPYIKKIKNGELTAKDLANALKTAINSVYGLTAAKFDNEFRDTRNVDNIVAKRGALFMIELKHEVQKRGFTVAHIKTDSIKIPNATKEIIDFVMDFGKKYGYTFEHEATYEKMCLVNKAVYIAKHASKEKCKELYGYIPGDNVDNENQWTATGKQFQVPYVFKTLFSKEPIIFDDMCEVKAVKSAIYLDFNESLVDVSAEEHEVTLLENKLKPAALEKLRSRLSEEEYKHKYAEMDNRLLYLQNEVIPHGHDYKFVGKVGQFTPVKEGTGGGRLCRVQDGKYNAVEGTIGYRWKESEVLRNLHKDSEIDTTYYERLVDEAVDTISQYGDFEWFSS